MLDSIGALTLEISLIQVTLDSRGALTLRTFPSKNIPI